MTSVVPTLIEADGEDGRGLRRSAPEGPGSALGVVAIDPLFVQAAMQIIRPDAAIP